MRNVRSLTSKATNSPYSFSTFSRWAFSTLVLGLLLNDALAGDWPRYRGPNRDNISPEAGELNPWPAAGPRQLWRANVGVGFSGLALSKGRLFTIGNAYNTDTVFCLDATTGEVIWTNAYPASLAPILYEGGPSATPTVDGDLVYTLGKAGDLFCFEAATGAIVWSKKLINDLQIATAEWGFASSPLILGEKLILNAGGYGCALDKATGDLIWMHTTNKAGYATPVPCEVGGTNALLIFAYRELAAVRSDDGVPIWNIPWKTHYDMNCADPFPYKGRFFVSSYTHSATMLEFTNGRLSTNWQNRELSIHLSPGVVYGRHMFAFHGDAELANTFKCLDLDTGQIKWSAPAMPVGAVIGVGNRLLILTGNGQLVLAEASPDAFTPLAQTYVVAGRCWTMPTYAEGTLYIRTAAGEITAFEMDFTPAVDPSLSIARGGSGGRVILSWPLPAEGFQLQQLIFSAVPPEWTDVTDIPTVRDGWNFVTNHVSVLGKFFRLRRP